MQERDETSLPKHRQTASSLCRWASLMYSPGGPVYDLCKPTYENQVSKLASKVDMVFTADV